MTVEVESPGRATVAQCGCLGSYGSGVKYRLGGLLGAHTLSGKEARRAWDT